MGRKSKPIMHLIILLCGLFMHLIWSHPYSSEPPCLADSIGAEDEDDFLNLGVVSENLCMEITGSALNCGQGRVFLSSFSLWLTCFI